MSELVVGCSGFTYNHWRGNFYPERLPQKRWFAHYSTVFASVELNVTFYRLPKSSTFEAWRRETPEQFVFAIKGSRLITHLKRLKEIEEPLNRFFEEAGNLAEKLKVVLWQLPPSFAADNERLSHFLALLDRYNVRNTLEFRHQSWLNEETIGLCRQHNTALCMADSPEFLNDLPLTADFVYIRRHGGHGDHAPRYDTHQLAGDAERIRGYIAGGRDVYIYFNNDAWGYAPQNAQELQSMFTK